MAAPVKAGEIKINGSTTVLPVSQVVSEAFMEDNPGFNFSISGGGSGNGIAALIDGTTDIAQTSRWIRDSEVERAVENGIYPVPFVIAYDSIIPVVHPDNPVDELSLEELRKIYNGDITNWSEVGGTDRDITIISRDSDSGTYVVWSDEVLKGDRLTPRAQMLASNGAIVQTVQDNRHAIGYIGLGYLTDRLKSVKVDGVMPTSTTTASGEYPVSRSLWLITNNWPSGDVLRFINYIQHPDNAELIEEGGYVPIW
nr:PstS family phosphate ABC transporter substrate-binding protein [Desulfonatronospira thiodismutans]